MNFSRTHWLALVGTLFLFSSASAQEGVADTTQDEADVWAVVEEVWNADENGDREWIDRLLTDDFTGWNKNTPVPRNRASIKMWDRFAEQEGQLVAHELYPYRIIVRGDTAVAHYLYSSAYKATDGTISRSNGRYTDVLVRTDDGWKFLAWHGGDDE
ncbi:MAG: nuclear transport factor 2 family protein [Pseudomonadota bacterium]